ncbi:MULTISPECIES: DUF4367 domain-containing protein [unclassified Methanoculleus]|jgi:hypothetical protein|uniref:DUF4367 domain-containing protein n=1 Tax=Methanoculleus palmolei TaxID=72612 RepID=A0ABD8A643_9EURY|nr:DUF4367 domain-containing protein [Methanoculleus sp. UBA377]MDD2472813.1 DUF4367 domain-containing protein [Methanoculleus sp.]WOX54996.1 DUF4367 domain-containing protein [Methanoculleus palmolei]
MGGTRRIHEFPPAYVSSREYTLYGLQIVTVWNETEPYDRRTTIGETLRYVRDGTLQNGWTWTPETVLLEVSWSKYGYNPYADDQTVTTEPKVVEINEYAGQIYETEQERLIVWAAGDATYQVRGPLERDELIRVARSIAC